MKDVLVLVVFDRFPMLLQLIALHLLDRCVRFGSHDWECSVR